MGGNVVASSLMRMMMMHGNRESGNDTVLGVLMIWKPERWAS